jgi:hypothetical protein
MMMDNHQDKDLDDVLSHDVQHQILQLNGMVGMKKKSYFCYLSPDDLDAHYHEGPYQLYFFHNIM